MDQPKPLISVVIPTFNRANEITTAVKSVQKQTYSNWEIIISDDGSTDNTKEVVQNLVNEDKRIHFLSNDQNRGAQAARNTGIKNAQGEWIAFLDSDDHFLPESLDLRMTIAQRDHVFVVHSDAFIQYQGKPLERYQVPSWQGNIYKSILTKEGPMFPSLLIKNEALVRIGYLDENIRAYQEWDTCIRLAKYYEFGFEPQPTFVYDYRTSNAISRDSIRAGIGYEQSLTKHWKDIIFYTGFGTLANHYQVAADWYKRGNDSKNAQRCTTLSIILKFLSPSKITGKITAVLQKMFFRKSDKYV